MCDAFEAIAKTMGEVVGWVYPPLVAGTVVGLLKHPVSSKIP